MRSCPGRKVVCPKCVKREDFIWEQKSGDMACSMVSMSVREFVVVGVWGVAVLIRFCALPWLSSCMKCDCLGGVDDE